jgi:NADH-quinone oxidoreductase subunit L
MLGTLVFVVFTYLFAAEAFTHFLYPDPQDVARYFQAAALPGGSFDVLVVGAKLLTILSWFYLYAQAHGRTMRLPDWVGSAKIRLYVLFANRLYVDAVYARIGRAVIRVADYVDKRPLGAKP